MERPAIRLAEETIPSLSEGWGVAAALRSELEQTEREAKGVISAWEAKVAQLNDELEDAQAAAEDAAVARQEAVEAVRAEEEERFAREVGMLRGALEKLRADVSVTSQETQMRGFEAERLEEEKALASWHLSLAQTGWLFTSSSSSSLGCS